MEFQRIDLPRHMYNHMYRAALTHIKASCHKLDYHEMTNIAQKAIKCLDHELMHRRDFSSRHQHPGDYRGREITPIVVIVETQPIGIIEQDSYPKWTDENGDEHDDTSISKEKLKLLL